MKIQVVGTSGSGKSTFANEIASLFSYPHIEIDNLLFEQNWKMRPKDDFDTDLAKAIQQDNWVACGNYFSSKANIYEAADIVVWMNYPLYKILWQVTHRTIHNIWTKKPCCNGNIETIRQQFFSKNSIFIWVLGSHRRRVKKYTALSKNPDHTHKWIVITNEAERKKCLQNLREYEKRTNITSKP